MNTTDQHAETVKAGSTRRRWRAGALAAPRASTLCALALYIAYAIYMTWPVVTDLGDKVYGAPGDLTGSIALLREMVEGHHNPFLPGTLTDFNAPEGLPIDWRVNLSSWPSLALMYAIASVAGAATAFTIVTLLGYVASGLAMFLLVRRVSGNIWAALIVGWAFAFYPFAELNGQGHNALVHGWVFVIMVWRALVLHESPNARNGVALGFATILAMAWTPYFILFAAVLLAVMGACEAIYALIEDRRWQRVKGIAIAGAMGLGYAGLLAGVTLRGGGAESALRVHGTEELTVYSARAFEYVVPPAGHLIFGDRTAPYLAAHAHGSNPSENTLYVGVSIIMLALVGLLIGVRRRGSSRQWYAVGLFAAVAVVAFVFSAPPKVNIGPFTASAPAEYISHLTSTWRVYSRFVIIVMLGLCLLAGLGLAYLADRLGPRVGAAALLAATIVVPLDLINRQESGAVTHLTNQPIYEILAQQPKGIVAQYPLYPDGYGDYSDIFFQQFHRMRVLNGYAGTAESSRDLALADLSAPGTVGSLRTLGVHYILVTDVPTQPPVVAPGQPPARDAELIGTAKYGPTTASLYRVTARARPLISGTPGFGAVEGTGASKAQWLTAATGEIDVMAACSSCSAIVRFRVASFIKARRVTVAAQDGRVLWQKKVEPGGEQPIVIPVRIRARKAELQMRADPGTEPVPGPDPRSVSVQVIGLGVTDLSG